MACPPEPDGVFNFMDYQYILDLANELLEMNPQLTLPESLTLATQIIIADSLRKLSKT